MKTKRGLKGKPGRRWHLLKDEELLGLRLRNLPLRIEGTWLEERVARLYAELEGRGIVFKPHVWLGQEWFSPDGTPGLAIPFYLAHRRLMKLERKLMVEVEGGTENECMRILRHEAGHAIDTAYRLHFRRRWRELFGSFTEPYPDSYKPRPNSRRYVLHLDAWYAQAHPAEDFAETFAVWLNPNSRWRRRYDGWPALEKLEYVNELMREISGQPPKNRSRQHIEPLSELKLTLREHYRQKRELYAVQWAAFYDKDLRRVFTAEPKGPAPTAASFLRGFRRELCERVAEATGVHQYTINHLLSDMIERCLRLKLRLQGDRRDAAQRILVVLTVHTMNVVHSGYSRIAI